MTETRIPVRAERPYEVIIGRDLRDQILPLIGPDVRRVAVLHPPTMIKLGEDLERLLAAAGLEPVRIDVPDGEAAKTADVAANCWSVLGTAGFTRSDAVLGVGGGSTTDLAGFVAATWLRGVRLVTMPTTHWRWSTQRWVARPASIPQKERISSARSMSRPACSAI
jgi:3-dehydroquinate synthase